MNEDLKPVYDIDSDWLPCISGKDRRVIKFFNTRYQSLYRIIDFNNETVRFSDLGRIEAIKDINKMLTNSNNEKENMDRFLPICNLALDSIRPITMPYVPEKLICYIENFPGFDQNYPDTVGVLYFRKKTDDEEGDEMISCKRFFRIHPVGAAVTYEEINLKIYNDVKSKWIRRCEDADTGSGEKDNSKC